MRRSGAKRQLRTICIGLACALVILGTWQGWRTLALRLALLLPAVMVSFPLLRWEMRRAGIRRHADHDELVPVALEFSWRRALVALGLFLASLQAIPALDRLERTLGPWGEDLALWVFLPWILLGMLSTCRLRPVVQDDAVP